MKKKTFYLVLLSVIMLAFIVGLCGFMGFIFSFYLIRCLLILSAAVFLFSLVFWKKEIMKVGLGLWIIAIIFPLCAFMSYQLKNKIYKYRANKVVEKIYRYKKESGEFPDQLERVVNSEVVQDYGYLLKNADNDFLIYYMSDGWHTTSYDSRSGEWIISD